MVFVLFCQISFDISCQLHNCLNIPTHPTAHMSSSIATSIDKWYLYLYVYLWDKIRTLYNHNPFVYSAGQNHAYSQLQSSLHHNSFDFLCMWVPKNMPIWWTNFRFLISNFHHVLNVVCFLLGNSPASEVYMPMFQNTLSVPSSQAGRCV
jgi:hypothetical protein